MRSSYLGVTKCQTRSAHSSAETERQNLGVLLERCAVARHLPGRQQTWRPTKLPHTDSSTCWTETRSELRDKRGTVRSATKHTAAGYSIEHEAHGGRKTPPSASTTPLSARLMPQLGSERSLFRTHRL